MRRREGLRFLQLRPARRLGRLYCARAEVHRRPMRRRRLQLLPVGSMSSLWRKLLPGRSYRHRMRDAPTSRAVVGHLGQERLQLDRLLDRPRDVELVDHDFAAVPAPVSSRTGIAAISGSPAAAGRRNSQPFHLRHHEVEQDQPTGNSTAPGAGDRARSAPSSAEMTSVALDREHVAQDLADVGVVVDDAHRATGGGHRTASSARSGGDGRPGREVDREPRAVADRARDRDPPPVGLHDRAHDEEVPSPSPA